MRLNKGEQVSDWAIKFVTTTADVSNSERMNAQEVAPAFGRIVAVQQRALLFSRVYTKYIHTLGSSAPEATVRPEPLSKKDAKSEVGPASAFCSCIPTGMHGPTCIFWANLTPLSL